MKIRGRIYMIMNYFRMRSLWNEPYTRYSDEIERTKDNGFQFSVASEIN